MGRHFRQRLSNMKLNILFAASALANDGSGIQDNTWYQDGAIVDDSTPLGNNLVAKSGGRLSFDDNEERAVKRYSDLMGMAKKLWAKNGLTGKDRFDHRLYWGYGCHCFHLGDRPMTDDKPMPFGMPKDELDSQCRVYKQCQKCARMYHGDNCIGEFTQYRWRWANKRSQFESKNPAGTCERAIFECDKQFVYNLFNNRDTWNKQYHVFYSAEVGGMGFDATVENCPNSPGVGTPVHRCCGGGENPFTLYNDNQKTCCKDGVTVVREGQEKSQCPSGKGTTPAPPSMETPYTPYEPTKAPVDGNI